MLTGAGQQIVLAIDRLGDRRYCYINGGQFPFSGDVPPGEWRCGQPNVRVGIFGVINDDFIGAACDDGVQNGDETDVDCGGSCDACNQDVACREDADCAAGESCIAELCRDGAVRAGGHSEPDRNAADYVETGFEFAHGPIIQVEDAMTVTHIGLWTYAGGNAVECHLYPRNDVLFRAGSNAVLLEPAIAELADNIATVEGRNEIRLTRPVAIQPGEYVPLCHWHQGDNPTSNLFPIMGVSVPMAEPSGRHSDDESGCAPRPTEFSAGRLPMRVHPTPATRLRAGRTLRAPKTVPGKGFNVPHQPHKVG